MVKFARKCIMMVLIALVLLVSANAFAEMLIGSPLAGWQDWEVSNLNNNGIPYWDRSSRDGSNRNIGYCLTSDNCGSYSAPPGTIPYWGMNNGAADPSFYFVGIPGSNDSFTLILELAGYSSRNIFGWYEIDPGTGQKIGPNNVIFNGSDSPGASETITVSQYYGFFFQIPDTGRTYYTQSQYNSDRSWEQHFSIFKNGDTFWMGMEDLYFCNTDKDYNDMILRYATAEASPVPEPSTFFLMGAGLLGVGLLRKRFTK
jgi:PEP-CTERM motif/Domain of unknown function (DUF4114)